MAKAKVSPVSQASRSARTVFIQMRPWDSLEPFPLNPRKRIDVEELAELAESIFDRGVMQNLVGRPTADGNARAQVVAGSRRYHAVQLLIDAGRVEPEYLMPIRLEAMDDREALRFAMAENVSRRDMTALEEADGFAQMIELGDNVETIAAATGYPLRRIQQRLALHHRLSDAVRQAFNEDRINLGQLQAFTLGDKDRQEELLPQVAQFPRQYEPAEIRRLFTEKFVPMSRAIFPRERYKAALRKDLFATAADEEFAEDRSEFARLQREAVEEKRVELAAIWSWVEVQQGAFLQLWHFDRDDSAKRSGAIIHLRDDLRVEIHTGLVRRTEPAAGSRSVGQQPLKATVGSAPGTPAPAAKPAEPAEVPGRPFTKAHLTWARQEKTRRLQRAVANDHAVTISVAILGLLGSQEVRIRAGAAWNVGPEDRFENKALRTQIQATLKGLNGETTPTEAVLFRKLLHMPGDDRRRLFDLLVAEQVGTWPGYQPDLGDTSLAAAIAEAVDAVEPESFLLDTRYLEMLSKAHLLRVAGECRVADYKAAMTRDELIDAIALSDTVDVPKGWPPELRFGSRPELMRRLGYESTGGG